MENAYAVFQYMYPIVDNAQDLAVTYEQLRCCVSEAHRLKRSVVIGGDFNTQVNVGTRGTLLEHFAQEFGLNILFRRQSTIGHFVVLWA